MVCQVMTSTLFSGFKAGKCPFPFHCAILLHFICQFIVHSCHCPGHYKITTQIYYDGTFDNDNHHIHLYISV